MYKRNNKFCINTKILFTIILVVLLINKNYCQTNTFAKYVGSAGIDYGYYIQQTEDGGYIATGKTESNPSNGTDIVLIKFDKSGNQEWYRTFGGRDSEWGKSVYQTSDGGYIITGWTISYSSNEAYDLWLIKTDAKGILEWDKVKNTPYASDGLIVKQTPDEGYIVAGEIMKAYDGKGAFDALIIKTDKYGDDEWSNSFGGNKRDLFFDVLATPDKGYIFLGFTITNGTNNYRDYWLVKTSIVPPL